MLFDAYRCTATKSGAYQGDSHLEQHPRIDDLKSPARTAPTGHATKGPPSR